MPARHRLDRYDEHGQDTWTAPDEESFAAEMGQPSVEPRLDHEPLGDEHRGCPSGKRTYWSERLAQRAVAKAADRGELGPMRYYECPECDEWHLATKRN